MGKALNRIVYFDSHIKNQPTAEEYLKALNSSPYRTHQRMAVALLGMYKDMSEQQEEENKFNLPEA